MRRNSYIIWPKDFVVNQKISLIILVIVGILLVPSPVFAERIISIEKTVSAEKEILMQIFSDLEAYPHVIPENIKSSTIVNPAENIARMTFSVEGIMIDVDIKYQSFADQAVIEVVSGDLKGTKLTGIFAEAKDSQGNDKTHVNLDLDLKISWYLSLISLFFTDDNIESMMNISLSAFSNYANNPQPAQAVPQEENTCVLFWCW